MAYSTDTNLLPSDSIPQNALTLLSVNFSTTGNDKYIHIKHDNFCTAVNIHSCVNVITWWDIYNEIYIVPIYKILCLSSKLHLCVITYGSFACYREASDASLQEITKCVTAISISWMPATNRFHYDFSSSSRIRCRISITNYKHILYCIFLTMATNYDFTTSCNLNG